MYITTSSTLQRKSNYENGTLVHVLEEEEDDESPSAAVYSEEMNIPFETQKLDLDNTQQNHASSLSSSSPPPPEPQSSSPSPSLFEKDEICSYFPSQSFTASNMWQMHLDGIFNASHNPDMPQELSIFNNTQEAEKMHHLLHHTLSPSRMRKGILHMPTLDSTHDTVKHIVQILENRIRDPSIHNPPLKIAVFGGSVTIGRGCHGKAMVNRICAWPRRFELLINQFVGMDLIKIYNLGIGGTNTNTARNMVDYWMYPDDLKKEGPDVIINSYSTNGKEKKK